MNTRRRHGCFRFPIGILAVVLLVMSGAAKAGDIRILPTADILRPRITLGDVAVLRGFDPEATREIRAIVLAETPHPGAKRIVHANEIELLLREAGVNMAETRLYGSMRCEVTRLRVDRIVPVPKKGAKRQAKARPARRSDSQSHSHTNSHTHHHPAGRSTQPGGEIHQHHQSNSYGEPLRHRTDPLEDAVYAFVSARMPDLGGEFEVTLNRRGQLLKEVAESGAGVPTFQVHERDPVQLGLCGLDVDIYQQGTLAKTIQVVAQIELVKQVLIARSPINRGQTIDQRDLRVEKRRFDRLDDVGLSDMSLAVGYQATRYFPAGEMLTVRGLEEQPLIRRGETVKILLRGAGVQITTMGKAQKEGALGDVIPVAKNGSHRKRDIIDAMVTGPGVVTYGPDAQVASR